MGKDKSELEAEVTDLQALEELLSHLLRCVLKQSPSEQLKYSLCAEDDVLYKACRMLLTKIVIGPTLIILGVFLFVDLCGTINSSIYRYAGFVGHVGYIATSVFAVSVIISTLLNPNETSSKLEQFNFFFFVGLRAISGIVVLGSFYGIAMLWIIYYPFVQGGVELIDALVGLSTLLGCWKALGWFQVPSYVGHAINVFGLKYIANHLSRQFEMSSPEFGNDAGNN